MNIATAAQYEAEIVELWKEVDSYKRAFRNREPVAYVLFAANGNVRMWSRDKDGIGPHAVPVYLHPEHVQ